MILGHKTMAELFSQLGLANTESEIEIFINSHTLDQSVSLECAPFLSPWQQEFIKDAWINDSDWSAAIDALNVALRK
ncbi:DUF2789 family protein [Thalassomonas actiniarum]|uniref:DUF2789 family protein n=1 Tax=Thalassomonas actiniarum TaxID=485447 RepID=A0AAE9YX02_9GAMM|nr:DUF2789 family protein [Thalassomonas actiniarum]WDE02433.1 DUF2789 family protein [Thalassomonas actiniarum]